MDMTEHVHTEEDVKHIEILKQSIPDDVKLQDLAQVFKVFGDATRIKILWIISNDELCVCQICELMNMTQSAVSHQLRVLRQAKLVKYRKQGKQVLYTLDDEHIGSIITAAWEHICE